MYRSILMSAAAFVLLAGTVSAEAACGVPTGAQAAQIKLPPLSSPPRQAAIRLSAPGPPR